MHRLAPISHKRSASFLPQRVKSRFDELSVPAVDVGWVIPFVTLQQIEDCAQNIGRSCLRKPIVRRLLSTAETTLLPALDRSRDI